MKTINKFRLVIVALVALLTSSCIDHEFDKPEFTTPDYTGPQANTTLAQLRAMLTTDTLRITPRADGSSVIVKGVVVANDISGNIFKSIYIQDASGGMQIQLDRYNLYTNYQVGQILYVKCDGLYLGKYGGVVQLGYSTQRGTNISGIPSGYFSDHLFLEGLPNPKYVSEGGNVPNPKEINSLADLNIGASDPKIGTLVKLKNVSFFDAGAKTFADYQQNNVQVPVGFKSTGDTIVSINSGYSNFYSTRLPSGTGDIICILSFYSRAYQVAFRSIEDIPSPPFVYNVLITSPSFATATIGVKYEYTITATPATAETTISAKGLPSWATLTDNHNGTATVSGTPDAVGTSNVEITATNNGLSVTKILPLVVSGPEISIASLRAMYTGTPQIISITNRIVGVVISDKEGGNSTSLKNFTIAAVDNSTGIAIRIVESQHPFKMNDKIEILLTGATLTAYAGALQLENVPLAAIQKTGTATITPRVTTIADIKANFASKNYESTVVTIQGTVSSPNGNWGGAANQNNTIAKDGSDLIGFVAQYATFKNTPVPTSEATLTGIASKFNSSYQLIIRNLNDVK